jgi:membrane protein
MPSPWISQTKDIAQDLLARWKNSRLARALKQYTLANGALLCGGITYKALFSLFAALTIGFTVFVRVLGNNVELRDSVVEAINNAVPGLIADSDHRGILSIDDLVVSTGLNLTSIIAFGVLLWAVITCMDAVRASVRAMFSLPPKGATAIGAKLRSLAAFVCVAVGILLSSVAGVFANSVGRIFDDSRPLGAVTSVALNLGSHLATLLFDAAVFVLIVRLLAGVKLPRRDLLIGAVTSAIGFAVIRYLGTSVVVGSATNNPLFATGAVLVTILVWLYMCSRILLTASALAANVPLEQLEKIERDLSGVTHDPKADDVTAQSADGVLEPIAAAPKSRRPALIAAVAGFIGGIMFARSRP